MKEYRQMTAHDFDFQIEDYLELQTIFDLIGKIRFVSNDDMYIVCESRELIEKAMFNRLKNLSTLRVYFSERAENE